MTGAVPGVAEDDDEDPTAAPGTPVAPLPAAGSTPEAGR
jgi:hypothetical protein